MVTCENDTLVIPEEYKKMSVSQLRTERERIYKEVCKSERPKKILKKNKQNINFKF